ncbi:MAG: hypothetical protein ACI906_002182 [Candidatus Latescibacterota bacterium]|jgi:hypothetical protein
MKKKMHCDTCGKEVDHLRRDVIDAQYNALNKPPLWNCTQCYEEKRAGRDKDRKAN